MKTSLRFKLPEEQDEFETAIKAMEYRIVISEVLSSLRDKLKYGVLSDEQYHAIEAIQAEVIHLIRVRGLEL